MPRSLTVFAPAKINLYLHVTGRRADGYHLLDSLAAFADIGDRLVIEPAHDFSFQIEGPYARAFTAADRGESNLVVRAARALARQTGRPLPYRMILHKNLPLASGLGGGSADAAAVIWGLMGLWGLPLESQSWLPALMTELGADVPPCLRCVPVRFRGIGDILDPVPLLPEIPVVLVNPNIPCPTPAVFQRFHGSFRDEAPLPEDFSTPQAAIEWLRARDNDLLSAAVEVVPAIRDIIAALSIQRGCALARMSGSGASVFALFETMDDAQDAAEAVSLAQPGWWVRAGTINSPQRY